MAQNRFLVVGLALAWLLCIEPSAFAQCGGTERWPVKVAADPEAGSVDLSNRLLTTLADLVHFKRPQLPSDDETRLPEERTVRIVDGRLVKFKLESGKTGDRDYHLVISDDTLQFSAGGTNTSPSPHSFVAEVADTDCIGGRDGDPNARSRFQDQLAAVRRAFDQQFPTITGGWNDAEGIPVRITGVSFFDRQHGQVGRALNGMEIHPVLEIVFNSAATKAAKSFLFCAA